MSKAKDAAAAFPEKRALPPLSKSLRDQAYAKLDALDERSALLAVSLDGKRADVALMVNGGGGWSFVGWLQHDVAASTTAGGVEVRKKW